MSIFRRLFAAKGGSLASAPSPARPELLPPTPGKPTFVDGVAGRVAVDFHVHSEVEGVPGNFLTAVSEGLATVRQRELVLTLRLATDEDPIPKMQDILRFVVTVHAWAREGNLVDQGGFTRFGARGLFARAESGILYADARPLGELLLPERALSAIFVGAQEIGAAAEFGTYRVLTRIGLEQRVFPHPIWGELTRPSVVGARESETQLARVARLRAPGVSFVVADRCISVTLTGDATTFLKPLSGVRSGAPFALLTRPATSADAILVWSPGQEGERGISPDGSQRTRLSGSCLLVVPGADLDQALTFEDGYLLRFSNQSWARLSAALVARRKLRVSLADGMRFEIDWLPDA